MRSEILLRSRAFSQIAGKEILLEYANTRGVICELYEQIPGNRNLWRRAPSQGAERVFSVSKKPSSPPKQGI